MGGRSDISASERQWKDTSARQAQTAQDSLNLEKEYLNRGTEYQAPLVNLTRSIINGDKTATNQSIAPALGQIARTSQQAREQIYSGLPPGAARDYALSQIPVQRGEAVANITNQTYLNAFPTLAGLASGQTQTGLGLLGAGITGQSNSASTTSQLLKYQTEKKADTLKSFGSLAGTAAGIFTGGGLK